MEAAQGGKWGFLLGCSVHWVSLPPCCSPCLCPAHPGHQVLHFYRPEETPGLEQGKKCAGQGWDVPHGREPDMHRPQPQPCPWERTTAETARTALLQDQLHCSGTTAALLGSADRHKVLLSPGFRRFSSRDTSCLMRGKEGQSGCGGQMGAGSGPGGAGEGPNAQRGFSHSPWGSFGHNYQSCNKE